MRWLTIFGAILIVVGIGSLFANVLPFHHREEVAKIGSFTATQDKETDLYIPPYAGVAVIVLGAGLLITGTRRA